MFCRQGLAAWMHAWPQADRGISERRLSSSPAASSMVPAGLTEPLVGILASMVFSAGREAVA
jgi:hypothetical protein